jgi:hypothetical protein
LRFRVASGDGSALWGNNLASLLRLLAGAYVVGWPPYGKAFAEVAKMKAVVSVEKSMVAIDQEKRLIDV